MSTVYRCTNEHCEREWTESQLFSANRMHAMACVLCGNPTVATEPEPEHTVAECECGAIQVAVTFKKLDVDEGEIELLTSREFENLDDLRDQLETYAAVSAVIEDERARRAASAGHRLWIDDTLVTSSAEIEVHTLAELQQRAKLEGKR